MFEKIKNSLNKFINVRVDDEDERVHVQYLACLYLFSFVSFFMTILNVFTKWYRLGMITFAFGACSFIDVIIEHYFVKLRNAGRILFCIEMVIMFIMFLIIGEPEGFSALWILVVPCCGFFLFRMKYGLIVSTSLFVLIIFFLWTPIGRSCLMYEYTSSFMQRFPVIYLSFTGVGMLFEVVRHSSNNMLKKSKEEFEYMYNHDVLTGLYNRYGFNSTLDKFVNERKGESFAFGILDLDLFKLVNDKYGHLNGDIVLKEMGQRFLEKIKGKGIVCRWGGEEFSILFYNGEEALSIAQNILDEARTRPVVFEDSSLIETFSMGLVTVEKGQAIKTDQLVRMADACLYYAKGKGRNQICATPYSDETKFIE